jgi:hypothetical protein
MRNSLSLLTISIILLLGGCGATGPVQESAVTGEKQASDIAVRNAIIRAGHQHGWRMKIVNHGQILATRYKRGYMATTEIKYTPKSYSLSYKAATKKAYYDEWVSQLKDAIRVELKNS